VTGRTKGFDINLMGGFCPNLPKINFSRFHCCFLLLIGCIDFTIRLATLFVIIEELRRKHLILIFGWFASKRQRDGKDGQGRARTGKNGQVSCFVVDSLQIFSPLFKPAEKVSCYGNG